MKRFSYFLLLLTISENIYAQQASDYFPEQPGWRWEYTLTPLDSVNNEIETLRYYRHDLFVTESNYEGKLAKIVQTKSGPAITIHFQPYLDSLFFHFSGFDGYEYFKVGYFGILLSVLDSELNNPNFSFAELFNSLEEWYSIYRFSQTINDEYSILQIDTIVVIDSQTLPLRFEYLGERLQDEILDTPIGNLDCNKFVRKLGISYLIIPPLPLPPIAIPILLLKDYVWIAEDYWIIQEIIPSTEVDLSILGLENFFIPGLKSMIDTVVNTATVVDEEVYFPEEITLEQNFPNPFNPSTTIKFSLPASNYTTLKIYNTIGEEVAVLIDKELTAGTYEVKFDSHSGEVRNLPSGVYFYQLQTERYTETKKMLLMK